MPKKTPVLLLKNKNCPLTINECTKEHLLKISLLLNLKGSTRLSVNDLKEKINKHVLPKNKDINLTIKKAYEQMIKEETEIIISNIKKEKNIEKFEKLYLAILNNYVENTSVITFLFEILSPSKVILSSRRVKCIILNIKKVIITGFPIKYELEIKSKFSIPQSGLFKDTKIILDTSNDFDVCLKFTTLYDNKSFKLPFFGINEVSDNKRTLMDLCYLNLIKNKTPVKIANIGFAIDTIQENIFKTSRLPQIVIETCKELTSLIGNGKSYEEIDSLISENFKKNLQESSTHFSDFFVFTNTSPLDYLLRWLFDIKKIIRISDYFIVQENYRNLFN